MRLTATIYPLPVLKGQTSVLQTLFDACQRLAAENSMEGELRMLLSYNPVRKSISIDVSNRDTIAASFPLEVSHVVRYVRGLNLSYNMASR